MKTRNIIEIDTERCNGCGLCVTGCAEGAITIIDGKAAIISDIYCDGLGACLTACPQDALRIIQREAAPFDETAVERHLEKPAIPFASPTQNCPGATVRRFATGAVTPTPLPRQADHGQTGGQTGPGHWPLKIRLVPSNAPFLEKADVLVTADCAAAASPQFHQIATGKIVLIGCPKFEDNNALQQSLTDIFTKNTIQSITLLRMEVPCCQGLASACREALRMSGKDIPYTETIMNCDGTPHLRTLFG